jgi:hypothetical protein
LIVDALKTGGCLSQFETTNWEFFRMNLMNLMIFDICPWTKSDKLIQLLSQQHIDLQFDVFGNLMISMEWNCVEVSFSECRVPKNGGKKCTFNIFQPHGLSGIIVLNPIRKLQLPFGDGVCSFNHQLMEILGDCEQP